MCTDLGPELQNAKHQVVVPGLMGVMDDFSQPRVQAHAAAAIVNFSENCEQVHFEQCWARAPVNLGSRFLRLFASLRVSLRLFWFESRVRGEGSGVTGLLYCQCCCTVVVLETVVVADVSEKGARNRKSWRRTWMP